LLETGKVQAVREGFGGARRRPREAQPLGISDFGGFLTGEGDSPRREAGVEEEAGRKAGVFRIETGIVVSRGAEVRSAPIRAEPR
jgi:hypothetical protein